jgi:CheY-like chemotaxis protein
MGKKILLADDSITIQKVIELTFSDEDFDVVTVGNGRLALEKLAEVRPDIVLCDIIMPEKDGYEVCEQIKKNAAFAHVPVLLLTGAFEPFDQERAARAGYDGSLAKPFEPETLIAKVRDLLARAPARPTAAPAPPPPIVPFVRPAAPGVPPPPAVVAAPPVFAAPPVAAPPTFIPDEPFGTSHEPISRRGERDSLAPVSEEEHATLLGAPDHEEHPSESASTVMFKAADLPWHVPPNEPVTTPVPAVAAVAPPALPAAEPAFVPEREPVFAAEAVDSAEVVEEATVFEEVLEDDLDFGATGLESEPEPADTGATLMFSGTTLPPAAAQASIAESSSNTASFAAAETTFGPDSEFEPLPEPEPVPEPEPARVRAAEPPRMLTPPSLPPAAPAAPRRVEPPSPLPPVAAPPPQSFADVAAAVAAPEPVAPPTSEAAAVSVPVEMVEKIAQRVVAQISEKAVREIAWDVIPDLAEALIKQEIERLKAELQKI